MLSSSKGVSKTYTDPTAPPADEPQRLEADLTQTAGRGAKKLLVVAQHRYRCGTFFPRPRHCSTYPLDSRHLECRLSVGVARSQHARHLLRCAGLEITPDSVFLALR